MRQAAAVAASGSVSLRAVRRIVKAGIAAGVDKSLLLQASGLTDTDHVDPDARLPLASEIALWQVLARHVGDPDFGLHAGPQLTTRDAGLLGYVVCFTPTVGDALRALERYSRVFTEAVSFELRTVRDSTVACALSEPLMESGERLAQDFRLASMLTVLRLISGTNIQPAAASFTYAKPRSVLAHTEFFRCPLMFGARVAALSFHERDLALPLLRADAALATYISRHADHVLATLTRGNTVKHRVRAAIWADFANGKPTVSRIAARLGVPTRTLQRQLATEGTSLALEIQEIRKTMALAALRDHSQGIDDIAFLLGYTETSTFYRSFKRWTGKTPQQYRSQTA